MNISIKEKVLIGVIGAAVVVAISGSVWALTAEREEYSKDSDTTSQKEKKESSTKDKASVDSGNNEFDSDAGAEDTHQVDNASQSSTPSSPSQSSSSTPPSTSQPIDTNSPSSTPTNQHTVPSQQVMKCNEDMKALYVGSRDASIARENARWTKQQNDINDEVARRGVGAGHSGIAQGMINDARPMHEANLADIEMQYQYNLRSISC